jgi:hypothetical protein
VQLDTPIEGAAVLGGVVANRFGFAKAGGLQPASRDAVELQLGLDGVGTTDQKHVRGLKATSASSA